MLIIKFFTKGMKMLCAFGRVIEMMHNMKEWLLVEEMNTKSQKPLNLLRKKMTYRGAQKRYFLAFSGS